MARVINSAIPVNHKRDRVIAAMQMNYLQCQGFKPCSQLVAEVAAEQGVSQRYVAELVPIISWPEC